MRCSRAFFHPQRDSDRLLDALRDTFSLADLQASGCVVQESEDVVLHPYLRDFNSPLTVLQTSKDCNRRDNAILLSSQGSLPEGRWAFYETLQDTTTQQSLNRYSLPLLITGAWPDLVLLRTLGFPAAPASGLSDFDRKSIDTFCSATRIPRRIEVQANVLAGAVRVSPIAITLVGYSATTLCNDVPPAIQAVMQHLIDLHHHLLLPVDSINCWTPSAMSLQSLQYAQRRGSRADICWAFQASLGKDSRPIVEIPPPPAPNLQQLELQLAALQANPYQKHKIQEITRQLHDLRQRQLIQPLRREAERCPNAIDCSQMLVLADSLELQYQQSQHVRELLQQRQGRPDAGASQAAELEFRKWMQLSSTVQKQFSSLRKSLPAGRVLKPSQSSNI